MNTLINPADLKLSAELKLTSNGDNAKSAKVTLVARTGDAIDHPYWGRIVHDFAGMKAKSRIPLDYAHDSHDSIGYLSKFDTSSGDLVCSGAVVLIGDEVVNVVAKMQAGVPYEASIEFGDDSLLEYVPEGFAVNVNGRDIEGPVTVVRQWTLKAVAICKFGADDGTSTELQFSEKKTQTAKKGFFVRLSKSKGMEMETNNEQPVQAVEASDVQQPEAAVDVEAKAEEVKPEVVEEMQAEVAQTVEASEPAEVASTEPVEVVEAVEAEPVVAFAKQPQAVEAVDPRAEYRQFVAEFGDKAGEYFAKGLSMSDATKEHMKFLKADNDAMKKRLSAVDRGAVQPVQFSDGASREAGPKGLVSLIRSQK